MTKRRFQNSQVRSDSKQHLKCIVDGCEARQCAKGMCHPHWKEQRLAPLTAAEKRAFMRRCHNSQPDPTRPEPAACECCGQPFTNKSKTTVPQLDHCHVSDIFRGWLCYNCNTSIGKLGDTIVGVQRAIDYLKRAYGKR